MATSPEKVTPSFWQSIPGFILKVFLASTIISVVIKFGGPHVPIPATNSVALGLVLAPVLIIASLLVWQQRR